MDFSWSEEQDHLHRGALAFAKERLQPALSAGAGREAWSLAGEFGLLGLSVPRELGGLGLDPLATSRTLEAFGEGCTDTGFLFSAAAHLLAAAMPVVEHGTPAQKERFLPAMCSGALIGANAITEAEAGSDVHALKTTALRSGGEYVLNGSKSYVTNGPLADVFLVYATTNPAHGYLGLSAFLVPRGTPGLQVGKPFPKMGLEGSSTAALYLEDCRVPADLALGGEGRGAAIFRSSMQWERACLFAIYLGGMERLLKATIEHAKHRRQFNQPIGRFQAVSHRVADMKLRLESARLLLYRATWLMGQGKRGDLEIALAKVAVSEAAVQAGLDAIQIHGGMGFMTETGIEQALRDAVPATIFSGTSEIQRDLIARELGL